MKYLPQVIRAKYLRDYTVALSFDDGTEKKVDLSQWFRGPVFAPLKNKAFFKRFFLDGGTVSWPNGTDIAPEALYEAEDLVEQNNTAIVRTRSRR